MALCSTFPARFGLRRIPDSCRFPSDENWARDGRRKCHSRCSHAIKNPLRHVVSAKWTELSIMTDTPNYHRIGQFGRNFIELNNGNLVLAVPPKDMAMVIQGSISVALFASFESTETTHVLLDALRWIEIIMSMSIPALSNPTMISWLVLTSFTEKVRECCFLDLPNSCILSIKFPRRERNFLKTVARRLKVLNYSREFRAWTDAFVEFSEGELVDEREKYRTGVAHDSPITPSVVPLCSATGSGASFEDIVRLGRGKWLLALFTRRLAYEHRMIIRPSLSM